MVFRHKFCLAAGFLYPQKKSIKNLNLTQALKSLGINLCSLVQLNISLKKWHFYQALPPHSWFPWWRSSAEDPGECWDFFPWDFMGFHGFCGWKSGHISLRLVVTPLPKDACSSIREYLTYSETTKSSLARLFSDSPMETQDVKWSNTTFGEHPAETPEKKIIQNKRSLGK